MTAVVVLVLLAVVAVALEVVARILAPFVDEPLWWHDRFTQRKEVQMRALRRHGGVDLVMVGSSMVLLGMDPDTMTAKTGLSSYNASILRGLPRLSEAWLRDRVLGLLTPRFVFVGLTPVETNDNMPLKEQFDLYRAARVHTAGALGRLWQRLGLWSAALRLAPLAGKPRTSLNAIRAAIRHPGQWQWSAPSTVPGKLGAHGGGIDYLERSYWNSPRMTQLYRNIANNYDDRDDEYSALLRIAELCRRQGAKTIYVAMPGTAEYKETFHEGGRESWERMKTQLHARVEAAGHPVIDVADEFEDTAYYADLLHMNRAGRDAFTARVAEEAAPLLRSADALSGAR